MNKIKQILLPLIPILAIAAIVAIGCGCHTVTTVTQNSDGTYTTNVTKTLDAARIASVSKQAATEATVFLLSPGQHPEWRAEFQLAESDLQTLAASPNPSLNDLMAIVQRLPVKQLQGSYAQLSFEGATILLSAIDIPQVPATAAADIKTIAQAIADGVAAGLAQVPAPTPPAPTNNIAPAATAPAAK